jgi:hypothetical protein
MIDIKKSNENLNQYRNYDKDVIVEQWEEISQEFLNIINATYGIPSQEHEMFLHMCKCHDRYSKSDDILLKKTNKLLLYREYITLIRHLKDVNKSFLEISNEDNAIIFHDVFEDVDDFDDLDDFDDDAIEE